MNHPVVWFEVLGNDGANLQRYYADLFGWSIKVQGPMKYGIVETGNGSGTNIGADKDGDRSVDRRQNDKLIGTQVGTSAGKPRAPSIPGGIGGTFPGTRSWVTFYVSTPDLERTMTKALELGGKVLMPPTALPDGPPIALFEDPEGHVIGLVHEGDGGKPL